MHVPRVHRNWESVVRVGKHVQNPFSFLHSLIIRNEPMHSRRLHIRVACWAASRAQVSERVYVFSWLQRNMSAQPFLSTLQNPP